MTTFQPNPSRPETGDQRPDRCGRVRTPRRFKKIWILPILVAVGLAIGAWQPLGFDEILSYGEKVGTSPLFLAMVVVGMIGCFTLGLPGSLGLWLIAPFNPPFLATILLLAGSVAGAAGACVFAGKMRSDWKPSGPSAKIFELLQHRGGFATQTALRMFPGFPHSVVNFAGGVLRLPLVPFLAAAVVGLAVKWGIYANAVHGLTDAVSAGEAVSLHTLLPLFALAALFLGGAWAKSKIR